MKYYQLLILGNGFDVHSGLQSRYKNFFRNALLDTIGDAYGLRQLRAGVFGFWEKLLLEYYKIYGDADYSWCDIEKIIKETLNQEQGKNLIHKLLLENRLKIVEIE